MTRLVAIDPGYAKRGQGCACALFAERRLSRVWFVRPDRAVAPVEADLVVYELPEARARDRVDPNVLVRLAAAGALVAGRYAGPLAPVHARTPLTWKGSTPKPVQHGRLWSVLGDDERGRLGGPATGDAIAAAKRRGARTRWAKTGADCYPASFATHNLLDAVALGAVELGRLAR